ncbi:MAG: hypothetical protein EP330_01040 [Deltaproteobacteria bacterium]|nr:MAG: hypothetical protein EP330_01040 [Deltaproteobacteria bacterium]
MHRHVLLVALLAGCGGSEAPSGPSTMEEAAAAKCPAVHLDRMNVDWILATGDPKTRLRIEKEGDAYTAYWVGGYFHHMALKGERREKDVRFEEIPSGNRKKGVEAGTTPKTVLYVEPSFKDCALQVYKAQIAGGKENAEPRPTEYLPFPDQGVTFSYYPATDVLFAGEAAKSKKAADKELEELGMAKADVPSGKVPVAVWSDATADGDPSCTYDMDLYFDDQLVPELSKLPAGEAKDGVRHWFHEWEAPFGGNHHFQMYRYRTCGDGARERIGIGALEAILM